MGIAQAIQYLFWYLVYGVERSGQPVQNGLQNVRNCYALDVYLPLLRTAMSTHPEYRREQVEYAAQRAAASWMPWPNPVQWKRMQNCWPRAPNIHPCSYLWLAFWLPFNSSCVSRLYLVTMGTCQKPVPFATVGVTLPREAIVAPWKQRKREMQVWKLMPQLKTCFGPVLASHYIPLSNLQVELWLHDRADAWQAEDSSFRKNCWQRTVLN